MSLQFRRDLTFQYGRLQEVAPGLRRIVAHNPSPYTLYGTGTYVLGRGQVAVIDPGPADDGHIDALLTALHAESVTHIAVTHTHVDHSPGAALLAARTGAPIFGCAPHRRHADAFTGEAGGDFDYRPHHELHDGEKIISADWVLEAIHTPGHTSNHLCYAAPAQGILFPGDHVMGWSTTVIAPPDGDMGAYMQSLERLAARSEVQYWPTHGPSIERPREYLHALYEHRVERERMVLSAVRAGDAAIPAMVARIYTGLDPRLVRAAQRTTWAHLLKLSAEGQVRAHPAATLDAHYYPC